MSDSPVIDVESSLVFQPSALATQRVKLKGTVYLLLDCSASMGCDGKLAQLKRGSLRFFAEAWMRQYAVGAIGFGSRAFSILGATRNFYAFQKQMMNLQANGRTAMDKAIQMGTFRLRFRRGHKVLMLMTDGQPNNPEATLQAAMVARRLGIELIVIGTTGADLDFLASLTPKPELVDKKVLAESIAAKASSLH